MLRRLRAVVTKFARGAVSRAAAVAADEAGRREGNRCGPFSIGAQGLLLSVNDLAPPNRSCRRRRCGGLRIAVLHNHSGRQSWNFDLAQFLAPLLVSSPARYARRRGRTIYFRHGG